MPIIPMIVWGAQRIWPKDHPKQLFLNNIPIIVEAGRPLVPATTAPSRSWTSCVSR